MTDITYAEILGALAPHGIYDKDGEPNGSGVPMMLAQTGGGCATLYIGEPFCGSEDHDEYPVVVGPGGYHWTDPNASTFTFDELFVGPDDMGETTPDEVHTLDALIAAVLKHLHRVTRDYYGQIAEDENGGIPPRPTGDLRVCTHCGRPAYYDSDDEQYHHAVNAAEGCFLIGAEERDDDPNHPLTTAAQAIVRYDKIVRANYDDAWDTLAAVAISDSADYMGGAWGELLDEADAWHDDALYDRLHIAFCEYQQRLRYEIGPERIAAQEARENQR